MRRRYRRADRRDRLPQGHGSPMFAMRAKRCAGDRLGLPADHRPADDGHRITDAARSTRPGASGSIPSKLIRLGLLLAGPRAITGSKPRAPSQRPRRAGGITFGSFTSMQSSTTTRPAASGPASSATTPARACSSDRGAPGTNASAATATVSRSTAWTCQGLTLKKGPRSAAAHSCRTTTALTLPPTLGPTVSNDHAKRSDMLGVPFVTRASALRRSCRCGDRQEHRV